METERNKIAAETAQINFKLSPHEREDIEKFAEKADVSISEYCRIKCLLDEDQAFTLKTKNAELEKTIKELRVRLSFYKEAERNPHDIVLSLYPNERELLEKLFHDYKEEEESIGWNILGYIVDVIRDANESWLEASGVTKEDIESVF